MERLKKHGESVMSPPYFRSGGVGAHITLLQEEEGQRLNKQVGHSTPTKYISIKSTTVYVPSSELGLSHPLSRQRVCPSPRNQGGGPGGHIRLRVRGWGSPNSDDWRKSLALCLLCGHTQQHTALLYIFLYIY